MAFESNIRSAPAEPMTASTAALRVPPRRSFAPAPAVAARAAIARTVRPQSCAELQPATARATSWAGVLPARRAASRRASRAASSCAYPAPVPTDSPAGPALPCRP